MSATTQEPYQQACQEFVSQWNRLVSTTNWEKGRIISQWRSRLQQEGADVALYSDDVWARQVGGVTPQHVGRLRRVADRFGKVFQEYEGLFWSHFQSALDWQDAEMWLEGAVQNSWSVSRMRQTRNETLGLTAESVPPEEPEEIVTGELDEDFGLNEDVAPTALDDEAAGSEPPQIVVPDETSPVDASRGESSEQEAEETSGGPGEGTPQHSAESPAVAPFADLPTLPADLEEASEQLKLVILRHKLDGWRDVTADMVVAHLDALKTLTKS